MNGDEQPLKPVLNSLGKRQSRLEGHLLRGDHKPRALKGAAGQHRSLSQRRRAHARGTPRHHRIPAGRRLYDCPNLGAAPPRRLHDRQHRLSGSVIKRNPPSRMTQGITLFVQCRPIDFAVCVARQRLQVHQPVRQHVFRQPPLQLSAQRRFLKL